MKINYLEAINFLRLPHVRIDFSLINVLSGPNETGKSSVADAICFVLTGETPLLKFLSRDDKKKEQLVMWGEERAEVTIDIDGTTLTRCIPHKCMINGSNVSIKSFDDYIAGTFGNQDAIYHMLNGMHFVDLNAKEAHNFLWKMLGMNITPKELTVQVQTMRFKKELLPRIEKLYDFYDIVTPAILEDIYNAAYNRRKEKKKEKDELGYKIVDELKGKESPKSSDEIRKKLKKIRADKLRAVEYLAAVEESRRNASAVEAEFQKIANDLESAVQHLKELDEEKLRAEVASIQGGIEELEEEIIKFDEEIATLNKERDRLRTKIPRCIRSHS